MISKSKLALRMRIDIVTETWPPEINGVALTVHALASGLHRRGHEISIWRPRQPAEALTREDPMRAEGEEGWQEYALPGLGLPRYPGLRFGLPAGRALGRGWRAQRPDAVYVATEGPLGSSAVSTAARRGIPCATGFHTRFDDFARHYGVGFLTSSVFGYLRRFHNRADATLVPTEELAGQLSEGGFGNVRLLRRAVDTEAFNPGLRDADLRREWGTDDDTLVLMSVGRLAPEKNLDLLIHAYRRLREQDSDIRLVMVGDGPLRSRLMQDYPDVIFPGSQRGEALGRHYASGDLFAFPSLTETFGNVTLEAMASGLATVAFDYGAAREHIESGVSGVLAPFGDAAAFTDAVTSLALDRDRVRRIGAAGREAVEGLTPDAVTGNFEQMLAQLAEERAA